MTASPAPVDVIVVGGGPVGVTTGLLLARRGISVRVFERDPEVYNLPRAIVMDAEIQRVYQNAGLQDGLGAITTQLPGAEFVRPGGERITGAENRSDGDWPLGHHPSVCYYQPELEQFLRTAAIDAGVELSLGTEVESVEQDEAEIRVSAAPAGGEDETHTAAWLVAADGASSPIRKSLDIPLADLGFDQDWLVLDVELTRPVDTLPTLVQQICDPDRPTTFVPGHANYRRWELQLQPGETREEMVKPDKVWQLISPWITPADARLVRAVVYRFHATVAGSMRGGRVLLAGDAAHQMPPFLGQGLCSGVRDAANLAWKLSLVHEGRAGDRLLDTYGEERLPHAEGLVAHAADVGRLIDQLSGRLDAGVGLDAGYGGGRSFPRLEHGVLVGDHPAVGKQLRQPKVGGRLLDASLGDGFALLVHDAKVVDDIHERWTAVNGRVVELPAGVFADLIPVDGAVFVRPDRYVAAVAAGQAEMRHVTERLLAAIGA